MPTTYHNLNQTPTLADPQGTPVEVTSRTNRHGHDQTIFAWHATWRFRLPFSGVSLFWAGSRSQPARDDADCSLWIWWWRTSCHLLCCRVLRRRACPMRCWESSRLYPQGWNTHKHTHTHIHTHTHTHAHTHTHEYAHDNVSRVVLHVWRVLCCSTHPQIYHACGQAQVHMQMIDWCFFDCFTMQMYKNNAHTEVAVDRNITNCGRGSMLIERQKSSTDLIFVASFTARELVRKSTFRLRFNRSRFTLMVSTRELYASICRSSSSFLASILEVVMCVAHSSWAKSPWSSTVASSPFQFTFGGSICSTRDAVCRFATTQSGGNILSLFSFDVMCNMLPRSSTASSRTEASESSAYFVVHIFPLGSATSRFLGFGLLCRHTASTPIIAGRQTSGAQ